MNAPRSRPRGAELASLGLAGLFFFLGSTRIAYQDLSALIVQEPAAVERPREHAIASPFGTIHASIFSLPQPVGTSIPEAPKIRLASLDLSDDIVGSIGNTNPPPRIVRPLPPPVVNRAGKSDRLVPAAPAPQPAEASEPEPEPDPASAQRASAPADTASEEFPEVQADIVAAIERDAAKHAAPDAVKPDDEIEAAMRFVPFPEYDISMSFEMRPRIDAEPPLEVAALDPADLYPTAPPSLDGLNTEVKTERILFSADPIGATVGVIEPWAVGEEPILLMPRAPVEPFANPAEPVTAPPAEPSVAQPAIPDPDAGITVATKGVVNPETAPQPSPAERLGLTGEKRERANKCLAKAIYFESGFEPVRGQIAVAQVVVNRAFSGYYPNDICGVVFQNAHRYMTCQFTFACNGKPLIASSESMWERSVRIAEDTLDGKLWLPEIGKATHYHADYVHPWWARTMNRYVKIGAHIFFRPRQWGDGADKPSWGSAEYTVEAARKL